MADEMGGDDVDEVEPEVVVATTSRGSRLDERAASIRHSRNVAQTGQAKQAKAMLSKNKKLINAFKVGDMVLLATD